ncbi:hypothetical protein B0H67DRAFT_647983 [Lasiosphaeris hirsuta]|uniref:Uncharacterized protein n=1 Tax=Lasiosphaeris hirsuta TaxID=260670 RepID=A0AA40A1Z9_9PEZI|nr:hypothetical protein B0H67DRAFT_647983 [Lasiosphaeris hirsuta]
MVQSPLDLASLVGTGEIPCCKEEFGPSKRRLAQSVQSTQGVQMEQDSLQHPRPIPRNFVWRLHGGRRSSSTSLPETEGDMAVEVPALRESFDPWGHHENHDKEEEDGRCKGCSKISKARAAAAAAAAVAAAGPGPIPPSHGESFSIPGQARV